MAYYNIYGTKQVQDAQERFNNVSNNAPRYRESTETAQARNDMNNAQQDYQRTVNQGYNSAYQSGIKSLVDKYNDENHFDWSAEGSAEYQGMKTKAKREGQRDLEDVQGAYSANTGGYGNSFAQAAGQRAYDRRMEELTAQIPALRQTALNNWSQNQERTMQQIGMMQGLDDTAYSRYRDKVSDKLSFMNYYQQKYQTAQGLDMSQFQNELSAWQARMGAASNDLGNIRSLAESQYEHNTVSADAQASIDSSRRQSDAYYDYLYSRLK
jgi:hypothetical protein